MARETLPLDMSHPAVKEYLALIRLQVLTPLSLLINVATVLVCTAIARPSIRTVANSYLTTISPNNVLIAVYALVIYAGQLGYCFLIVLVRKPETKRAVVKAVGYPLVLANWVMAAWAIFFVLQLFLVSTVFLGILLLLLIYSNIVLLIYHPPTSSRPLDTALIHAPLRFFLILPLTILFPYCVFITLGLWYGPSDTTKHYNDHPWSGFGVVFGTNLLGLLVIVLRRDVVWAVASTWLAVSIWIKGPKPSPVYATAVLFTVLHPLGLIVTYLHKFLQGRNDGRIALPPDHPDAGENRPQPNRAPREVDAEAVWS